MSTLVKKDGEKRGARGSVAAPGARRRIALFGCQIDRVRMPQAVARVFKLIAARSGSCPYVVTPNLDHAVMLRNHEGLRRAYDDAALVLADGMPLVWASRLLKRRLPERVTGADLVLSLFSAAAEHGGLRVFLLGAGPGVAHRASSEIVRRWRGVEVVGTYSPPFGFEADAAQNAAILASIAAARPDALVVGLGAPKQELWVHAHRHEIRARVALCVGATIDFLAGHKSRAPLWMRNNGLEWLHRLSTEPRRLFRRYARDAWHFPQLVWNDWQANRGNGTDPAGRIERPSSDPDLSRMEPLDPHHPETLSTKEHPTL